jgi:putative transposase
MNKFDKIRNCVFLLQYHLVLTSKYRKEVFIEEKLISSIKTIFDKIASDFDVQIMECECGVDHVHILFKSKPTLDVTKFINILKGHSSREIRKKYKDFLKDKLWGDHFWSPSYFLSTAGNVTIDVLKKYIETQRVLQK